MRISGPPTSPAAPPRRTLRAPCPVQREIMHARVSRAYQAEVEVWPYGNSPTTTRAPTTVTSPERGAQRVAICEVVVLQKQRECFVAVQHTAELHRW